MYVKTVSGFDQKRDPSVMHEYLLCRSWQSLLPFLERFEQRGMLIVVRRKYQQYAAPSLILVISMRTAQANAVFRQQRRFKFDAQVTTSLTGAVCGVVEKLYAGRTIPGRKTSANRTHWRQ